MTLQVPLGKGRCEMKLPDVRFGLSKRDTVTALKAARASATGFVSSTSKGMVQINFVSPDSYRVLLDGALLFTGPYRRLLTLLGD